jgi:peptide/nickel transport system substrate-binding protein/microcin C transport system substrate-binding protein
MTIGSRTLLRAFLVALTLTPGMVAVTALGSGVVKYQRHASAYDKLPPGKRGGTIYQQLSGNPKVINPILSNDNNSRSLEGYLWASLFTEDSDNLEPLPYLADGFEVSADRKTYTFTLNKSAKWADGSPVTTDDIKFTYETMMNPKTDAAALRIYWEGVKLSVKDSRVFSFTVDTPKFDTLRSLYLFQPLNKKQFDKEPDFNKARAVLNPVGNGPYNFKSFSRDQSVVLTRNKGWWGYELPHFKNRFNADEVFFRIIVDDNLAYEKFVRGDLDLMTFNPEQFAVKVQGVDKGKIGKTSKDGQKVWAQEIQNRAPRGYNYVGWNLRLPMFQGVKTRKALARLLDYKQVIDKVYHGYQFQCTSPFGSLSPNSAEDLRSKENMLTFDRKAAVAMLKADGWADTDKDNILDKLIGGKKVPFRFELKYNSNNPLRGKIAQIVKDQFKAAGIDVTVKAVEWNAYLDDIDHRKFEAFILGWTATPYPNAKQIWHSDSEKDQGSNIVGYSNKKVDALIDKSNVEFNQAKRQEIMKEINRLIYEDQPYLFLSEPRSVLAGFSAKVSSPSGIWAMKYDVAPPDDLFQFVP